MKYISIRQLTLSAALAALSATVQLIHIGYQSPVWGMWIDFVAVFWIIAFFLFGMRNAFLVSLLGALVICLFDPTSYLGAIMKWLATFPVIICFYFYSFILKRYHANYQKISRLVIPVLAAIFIRCLLIIPINYYFAIPIWTGMPPTQAMKIIPWYIIAIFNIVQTIIDVSIAWILTYKFKLIRYATKQAI